MFTSWIYNRGDGKRVLSTTYFSKGEKRMKTSKNYFKVFSLLLLASILLAACGGGGAATEESSAELAVGIVLPTKDEPRWVQDEAIFNSQLAGASFKAEILFSQADSAKEKANVETFITKGVKVIIICPQDGAAAAAAAEAARAAGVKVISYDRLILNTDAVDYYVTFDSLAVGAAQAQYLVDKATGSGNPLYLYAGASSDNNAFLFFEGAWNVLQPKIADGTFVIKNSSEAEGLQGKASLSREEMGKIIGQVTTDWNFNTAKGLAESNLTAAGAADKGDVFILAPNDGTARAIADAFAADSDVSSYVVTGQDAEKASVQYIIDGKQSMTVLKDVRTLVADALAAAKVYVDGGTPPQTNSYNNGKIDVPAKPSEVVSVDQANVKAAIIDSEYWPASDFTGLDTLGSAPQPPADPMAALYEAAKAEGMLTTIALPLDWCNYGGMYEGFKAKYPGIEINPLDPGAGSAEELEAIRANKDNPGPQAPDVVDIGLSRTQGAVDEGIIQAYKVATWDDIPDGAKDPDGYWYGDYYGVLAFEINASEVDNPPSEYADLLKPEYNGQVALSGDPLTSNAAALSVWAAGLSTGATGPEAATAGLDFFKQLNEAGNFVPIDGDSRTVGIGETPILIDWSYNSIANDVALDGNPDIVTNVPKAGIIAGIYAQAISAYAPHPNAAKLWMEYLYSDEGQQNYMKGFCYPIRLDAMNAAGSVPAELFEQLPSIEGAYFPTIADLQAATKIVVEGWPTVVGVEVK